MCQTSGCMCTKVSMRNSNNLYLLLQLSKEKQGTAISGVVEREWSKFTMERPSWNPLV